VGVIVLFGGCRVSHGEVDYSDYIKHRSNLGSGLFFVLGFMFTVITIVLSRVPNLDSLQSQLILLFFTGVFNLVGFLAFLLTIEGIYLCRRVPPSSKRLTVINVLGFLVTILMGFSVTLLFLLWNLTFLVVASGIVWALFVIAEFVFVWKPFAEHRKKFHS
jgi:hypothetical protein